MNASAGGREGTSSGRAWLFAGQGSQSVGMGVALAASCADCRATLDAADQALGLLLSRLMAEGPEEDLRRTAMAQPAILSLSVAHARHLVSLGLEPEILAGHSLGQYSALVVAGALDLGRAVKLVAERGRLMQETVPEGVGTMMAIVGLEREQVYQACKAAQGIGVVDVASHNSPGQTVISGAYDAVVAAADRCEEEGGAAIPLSVSCPFHSRLLTPMVRDFARLVEATPFTAPALPVIDNVTARPLSDVTSVRQSLIAQITAPVLFEESLRYMADRGFYHFVQCGPGKSLLGFAKRVNRAAELLTFEEAATAALATPA